MLVLTRKLKQQIKIGDQITVTILRVKGQTVRLGIEAPRDVRVVRSELPPEGEAAVEEDMAIIEAIMTVTDKEPEGSPLEREARLATARQSLGLLDPVASPRLPQRKAYARNGLPPLKLAMTGPTTLAK